MMETPNLSDHNSNPYTHGTQMCPPSRELPDRSPSQVESTRKSKTRLANFTIQEDLALVSSWLAISQDPVQSNGQKYEILWTRVHEYYHIHTTSETKRTKGSLQQRWSTIHLSCKKYSGCLVKIESMHQSGMIEENKIDNAKQLYKETYSKRFVYEHCWNVLKHAPKWLNSHQNETPRKRRGETISSLNSINLEDEDVANDSNIDLERPLGKKAEKARLNKQKSNEGTSSNMEVMLNDMVEEKKKINEARMEFLESGCIDFMELENKRLCIKQEKIELAKMKEERERMKEEKEIMTMNLETLPQVQQEYFRALQLEILAKRRIDN